MENIKKMKLQVMIALLECLKYGLYPVFIFFLPFFISFQFPLHEILSYHFLFSISVKPTFSCPTLQNASSGLLFSFSLFFSFVFIYRVIFLDGCFFDAYYFFFLFHSFLFLPWMTGFVMFVMIHIPSKLFQSVSFCASSPLRASLISLGNLFRLVYFISVFSRLVLCVYDLYPLPPRSYCGPPILQVQLTSQDFLKFVQKSKNIFQKLKITNFHPDRIEEFKLIIEII